MEPVEPVQMNIYQINFYIKWIPIHESLFYHIMQSNVQPCSGLEFSHISSPLATTASHFLHYLLFDQLCAREVYFCSFVTKSNQASTRYWPDVFSNFWRIAWRVPRDFHKPSSNKVLTFHYRNSSFCYLPIFFHYNPPSPLKTIHKISIAPDKAPHTLFFCFKKNSLFSPPSIPGNKSKRHMNPVAGD